jgi:hypothetical protein
VIISSSDVYTILIGYLVVVGGSARGNPVSPDRHLAINLRCAPPKNINVKKILDWS